MSVGQVLLICVNAVNIRYYNHYLNWYVVSTFSRQEAFSRDTQSKNV